MGWYGLFLVSKLKLAFSFRSVDEDRLYSDFELIDIFFNKYNKMREDICYITEVSEDSKTFSAKTTAKMFNVIDNLECLPEASNAFFLLYFLYKLEFKIKCYSEGEINLNKLKKQGWKIIEG